VIIRSKMIPNSLQTWYCKHKERGTSLPTNQRMGGDGEKEPRCLGTNTVGRSLSKTIRNSATTCVVVLSLLSLFPISIIYYSKYSSLKSIHDNVMLSMFCLPHYIYTNKSGEILINNLLYYILHIYISLYYYLFMYYYPCLELSIHYRHKIGHVK